MTKKSLKKNPVVLNERQLTVAAINRVKQELHSSTWQAFWKAVIEGRPARDVGLELKMTPGTVYVIKSQVMARLNEGKIPRSG